MTIIKTIELNKEKQGKKKRSNNCGIYFLGCKTIWLPRTKARLRRTINRFRIEDNENRWSLANPTRRIKKERGEIEERSGLRRWRHRCSIEIRNSSTICSLDEPGRAQISSSLLLPKNPPIRLFNSFFLSHSFQAHSPSIHDAILVLVSAVHLEHIPDGFVLYVPHAKLLEPLVALGSCYLYETSDSSSCSSSSSTSFTSFARSFHMVFRFPWLYGLYTECHSRNSLVYLSLFLSGIYWFVIYFLFPIDVTKGYYQGQSLVRKKIRW